MVAAVAAVAVAVAVAACSPSHSSSSPQLSQPSNQPIPAAQTSNPAQHQNQVSAKPGPNTRTDQGSTVIPPSRRIGIVTKPYPHRTKLYHVNRHRMNPHRGIGVDGRYKQPATKHQPPATVGVAGEGIEPHRTASSNT